MSLTKLYQAIKTSLDDLIDPTSGDKAFKQVTLFNNQTEKTKLYVDSAAITKLPAAFIQIKEADFMHLKNNVQRRTLRFCIHISAYIFDKDSGVLDVDKEIELFDLIEAVHCEINGAFVEDDLGKVMFTPFVRTEEKQSIDEDTGEDSADADFDPLYTHIITYETVQTVITARKKVKIATINRVLLSDVEVNGDELEITGNAVPRRPVPDDDSPIDDDDYREIIAPTDFPTT